MLRHLIKRIYQFENFVLLLLLSMMILSGLAQLLMRNLFDFGVLWNDALNKVLLLWTALLGALAATRKNRHIKISLLDRLLPKSAQLIYRRILHLLSGAICALVAWYSLLFVIEEYGYGEAAFAAVPLWLTESVIPLTFAVMSLRYFLAVALPFEEHD